MGHATKRMRSGGRTRNLHVWLIVAAALIVPAMYLGAGTYMTLLPVDGTLQNRNGKVVGTDFRAFYVAGELAAEGRYADVYDFETYNARGMAETGASLKYSWSYPPIAFYLVAPLAALPFIPAMLLWGFFALPAFAWTMYRALPHWLTPAVAILSPPVVHNFLAGQNGTLSAAILGGGLLLLSRNPVAAGLVFSLMAYKPHLALIVPVCLLAGGQYRAFAAMAVGGLALVLSSLAAFGLDTWIAFFHQVANHMGYVDGAVLPVNRFPTFYAVVLRLTGDVALARPVQGAVTVTVAILAALVWRRTEAPAERALALTVATLLATPYAYDYDLAILAVPFVWILKDYIVRRGPGTDLFALLAIWFAPLLTFFADAAIGWLILLLLLAYALRRPALAAREPASAFPVIDAGR